MIRDLIRGALSALLTPFLLEAALLPAAQANPYLARPGEKPVAIKVATCAGSTRPGNLDHRLSRVMLRKFHLENDVTIRPLGGSQPERYNAMVQDVVQAIPITPPLDARGKRDGFNILYNLGTVINRKAADLSDNAFAEHLDRSGFLRELWGADLRQRDG